MIISHYMLLKWDCRPCSARTPVSDHAWRAFNCLDCLRVLSVFESVIATTMVSKKMTNRPLMKFTEKHMNEIHDITRDISPLKMVLSDVFRKTFVTYNSMFFTSVSVGGRCPWLQNTIGYHRGLDSEHTGRTCSDILGRTLRRQYTKDQAYK